MSRSRRARALAAVPALVAAGLGGCGDDGSAIGPDGAVAFDRRAMLAHVADHFLIPTYDRFETEAAAMATAIAEHCSALAAGDGTATGAAARAA